MQHQTVLTGIDYLSVLDAKRITARISKDHGIPPDRAERILNGTMGFLQLSAHNPGHSFTPSADIDKGWHTLLLYTRTYRELCYKLGNKFIDHEPSDGKIRVQRGGSANTVKFMLENQIPFDQELWPGDMANDCQADPCNCTGDGYAPQPVTQVFATA